MDGSRGTIGLVVALVFLASGCTSSPWSAGRAGPDAADPPPAETPAAPSSPRPSADSPQAGSPRTGPASPGANAPDPEELHALMAELQQVGTLDPEAQQQLMEDLRQTDPVMWKPLVARFRAALAYRHRAERRRQQSEHDPAAGPDRASEESRPAGPVEAAEGTSEPHRIGPPPASQSKGRRRSALSGRSPVSGDAPPRQAPPGSPPEEEQAPADTRRDAHDRPKENLGRRGPGEPGKGEPGENVVAAGYDSPRDRTWQEHLAGAIGALESEISPTPKSETDIARHVYLRLLYLVAGRRDDAMRPIPSASPSTQDFWATELYGLERWLNAERAADPTDRAAEAKKSLDEAACKLGQSAPLVVRGLAFSTRIQSYGCYTKFAKDEFAPEQEVLLYAEVENFKSERTPKGFHTSLRSSYKVFDSRGQQVAEHEFPVTEEVCQSQRRDFFIGYHLQLPRRIIAGRHTLRLTIEDLKKGQIGQASIEFTVKAAKD